MEKDIYFLNRIFEYYYQYIGSGSTLLYIYLAMNAGDDGTVEIEDTGMRGLSSLLNMSHTSIRKYEIILCLVGLLKIEISTYKKHGETGYIIRKKKYIVFEPQDKNGLSGIPIMDNVSDILPSQKTERYNEIERIINQVNELIEKMKRGLKIEHGTFEFKIFKKREGSDFYNIDKLFTVYTFLPPKTILFYLYLWKNWLQNEGDLEEGLYIPRKELKIELKHGDEHIRESMYMLAAVKLINFEKRRYYSYYLNTPKSTVTDLIPAQNLSVLLPKNPAKRWKYHNIYQFLLEAVGEGAYVRKE